MKRCLNCMKEYDDGLNVCPHCGFAEGTPAKEIFFLQPGTMVAGRFIIGTSVGMGGFGIVYRAWDTTLEELVAIKEFFPMGFVNRNVGENSISIMPNKQEEFKTQLRRFLDEARYLAKFSNHPNIVNVYSYFEENNTAYIVMEFLKGKSFKETLAESGGKVPVDDAIKVISNVLGALSVIHKEHIVHRDIAPDNIFLCQDGSIKLMDFGAARLSKDEEANLTRIVKPGYAPPEQYQERSKQGAYTDVYAVGAVLYLAVTGVKASESTNRVEQDDLVEPRKINEDVNAVLNNTIMRALALRPELRFQSAEEFLEALKSGGKVRSAAEELKFRKRRRLAFVGVALVFLSVIGFVGFKLYDRGKSKIELKATSLNLWVSVPEYLQYEGSGVSEADVKEIWDSALSEYRERYPQVELNLMVTSDKTYEKELSNALDDGSFTGVYLATHDESLYGESVSDILKYVDESGYYWLAGLEEEGSDLVCPITFNLPVVFKLRNAENIDDAIEDEYDDKESNGDISTRDWELEDFFEGKRDYVISETNYYRRVQSEFGGRYTMMQLPISRNYPADYEVGLCITENLSEKEYNAAIQLLFYLLGEKAQTALCVENNLGLPVNKSTYETFRGVNVEFIALDNALEIVEHFE